MAISDRVSVGINEERRDDAAEIMSMILSLKAQKRSSRNRLDEVSGDEDDIDYPSWRQASESRRFDLLQCIVLPVDVASGEQSRGNTAKCLAPSRPDDCKPQWTLRPVPGCRRNCLAIEGRDRDHVLGDQQSKVECD